MYSTEDLYRIYLDSTGIQTDSRGDCQDKLFFALRGPSFDGNKYGEKAIEKGAKYAVIDDIKYAKSAQYIVVSNALKSLQRLSTFHRQQFNIPVLGITGSNGKTTTKELIAAVLKQKYKVHATPGNFNNLIGLPLTILSAPSDTAFLILEMGSNAQGEISALAQIGKPNYGLITSIGAAHIEGFGSLSNVAKEKLSLYTYVHEHKGEIFALMNDATIMDYAKDRTGCIKYGQSEFVENSKSNYNFAITTVLPEITGKFMDNDGKIQHFQTKLCGSHNANNVMGAIAVGLHFGLTGAQICAGLIDYLPQNNRTERIQTANYEVVFDAYNSNPTSLEAALSMIRSWNAEKRVLIIGQMNELGQESDQIHESLVADLQADPEIDKVIFVGPKFMPYKSDEITVYATVEALMETESFDDAALENAVILVKGSRSNQLEKLKPLFLA